MLSLKGVITEVIAIKAPGYASQGYSLQFLGILSELRAIVKVHLGSETRTEEASIVGLRFIMLCQMGYELLPNPALLGLCNRKMIGSYRKNSSSTPSSGAARRGANSELQSDILIRTR